MFIDGRANLNLENLKMLCQGFYTKGMTDGIQKAIDKLEGKDA